MHLQETPGSTRIVGIHLRGGNVQMARGANLSFPRKPESGTIMDPGFGRGDHAIGVMESSVSGSFETATTLRLPACT